MKRYISMGAALAVMLGTALTFSTTSPALAQTSASISGFVYEDLNNNGVKEAGEPGIAGVTIALSNDQSGVTTTDANGAYTFDLTQSGGCCTYTVTETQPAGFADGIDTIGVGAGSPGTLGNDVFTNIDIDGDTATGYNFGELPLTTPTAQRTLKTHTPTVTPTAPPSTATPTAVPATSTPQPSPAGGAGGQVRPPDTGTGGSSGRATTTTGIVFAALALFVAGGAFAGRGAWHRMRRQR